MMHIFRQNVGKASRRHIDDTVETRKSVQDVLERLSASAPERSFFKKDKGFKSAFPDSKFNCWACPDAPGGKRQFDATNIGDLVLIGRNDDDGIRYIGVVKAKCPVEARETSRILWPGKGDHKTFPHIFFFDTEIGLRRWEDFYDDFGYIHRTNFKDTFGWYRPIPGDKILGKWASAEDYLKFLRANCHFQPLNQFKALDMPQVACDIEDSGQSGNGEFSTPDQVQKHLERILPGEEERAACLSIFADSMVRLHERGPSHWGAYCDGDRLRLRGGGLIVLTIANRRVWLTLDQATIDASESAATILHAPGLELDPGEWAHYKRPRTTNVFYVPNPKNAGTWSLVRHLHFALLDRVAVHALRPDSQDKHQPSVSAYLGTFLRRPLPEPAYSSSGRSRVSAVPRKDDGDRALAAKMATIARMAATAAGTVANANGQQVLRTLKNKNLRFGSRVEFRRHIERLIEAQDGRCAITGLQLQFDGDCDDPELVCSLDRKNSDGHYEAGNLQVVCKFINRWKNDANDSEFRRLIEIVRNTGGAHDRESSAKALAEVLDPELNRAAQPAVAADRPSARARRGRSARR